MQPVAVTLSKCQDYSPVAVQAAVERMLANLGGIERFVSPGQSVLLKPNMLTDRNPDQAVTTHPEVVRALIRIVKKRGGRPIVADSPANVTKIERVWEQTGFRALCDAEDVPLLNLEKTGSVRMEAGGISFTVAKPVLEADVLVSIPKVKTHMLTIFTGAVKNLYGTIPGFQKATLHKAHPTPVEFGKLLAAIYTRTKPHLAVADAIVGMDGEGPSGGDPVKLGFLAASSDSVALDVVLCRILGIDTRSVPYFKPLKIASLGETDFSRIEMSGTPMRDLDHVRFRIPSTLTGRLIPRPLVKLLQPFIWIRPAFSNRCVSCKRCARACPMEALHIEPGSRPILDPKRCIGCCCCHEVCPERAVEMRLSPLLSFVRRGKLP